jgi:hypothetical protein
MLLGEVEQTAENGILARGNPAGNRAKYHVADREEVPGCFGKAP